MSNTIYTVGIDVGGSYVKAVLMSYDHEGGDHKLLDKQTEKIRKRDPKDVAVETIDELLERYC